MEYTFSYEMKGEWLIYTTKSKNEKKAWEKFKEFLVIKLNAKLDKGVKLC